jgi:hypothetical protein
MLNGFDRRSRDAGSRPLIVASALVAAAATSLAAVTWGNAAGTPPTYADCPAAEVSQPFAPWGDANDYIEVANGSFDDGLTGWTVEGKPEAVSLVQTPDADGLPDNALQLSKGGAVLSPTMCYDLTRPHAKLFARAVDGKAREKSLKIRVVYPEYPKGNSKDIDVGEVATPESSAWGPTPELSTSLERQRILPNEVGNRIFQLELVATGRGSWQLDDLYLDPRARY